VHAQSLVGIALALTGLGTLFFVLQRWWPAVSGLRRTRQEITTDLVYWLLTPFVTKPVARLAVVAALVPALWLLGRSFDRDQLLHGFGPAALLPGWMQAIIVVVIGDFIGYWMHRAFHRGNLWRFHAVHHSARELTWLSAVRVHPVNDALARMVQAVPFVALGFSPLLIGGYLPFLTFYAIMLHANLRWDFGPMRYALASPTFHRWHHADDPAARDKNFAGLLPVWDWMFGTLYLPLGTTPQSFGAQGESVPASWHAQMLYPFRRHELLRFAKPEVGSTAVCSPRAEV
jgi:sterol desaturase/sphingolipid hydroxylase (fatty acid hydroxylase superfamily)